MVLVGVECRLKNVYEVCTASPWWCVCEHGLNETRRANKVSAGPCNTLDERRFWHGVKRYSVTVLLKSPPLPGHEIAFTSPSMDSPEPVSQPGPQSWLGPLSCHSAECILTSACVSVCLCACVWLYVSSCVSVCRELPHLLCDFCTPNRAEPIYSAIHKPHGDTSPPSPHLCSRGSGDVGCSPAPPALCQSLVPYTGRY